MLEKIVEFIAKGMSKFLKDKLLVFIFYAFVILLFVFCMIRFIKWAWFF